MYDGSHGSVTTRELDLWLIAEPGSVAVARHELLRWARAQRLGVDEQDLAVAISEAVGNVVVHAYCDRDGGELRIAARRADHGLEVTIADQGIGLTTPHHSEGLGLGLPLMSRLADTVEFDSRPGQGTRVRLFFTATV